MAEVAEGSVWGTPGKVRVPQDAFACATGLAVWCAGFSQRGAPENRLSGFCFILATRPTTLDRQKHTISHLWLYSRLDSNLSICLDGCATALARTRAETAASDGGQQRLAYRDVADTRLVDIGGLDDSVFQNKGIAV